jgi:type I restriction enzyme M protein
VPDPAIGTGGFLINADRYIKAQFDDLHDLPPAKQNFQRKERSAGSSPCSGAGVIASPPSSMPKAASRG